MHIATITSASRLLPIFGLILLMSMTSGCATRALMSSDRHNNADPNKQLLSHASDMQIQELEQTYQLALQQQQAVTIK